MLHQLTPDDEALLHAYNAAIVHNPPVTVAAQWQLRGGTLRTLATTLDTDWRPAARLGCERAPEPGADPVAWARAVAARYGLDPDAVARVAARCANLHNLF